MANVPLLRPLVSLVEVVYELLYAHGVGVREIAVLHEAARHRVRSRIDVHGEGRKVVILRIYKGVDSVVLEERHVVRLIVNGGGAAYVVETFVPCRL